MKIISHLKWNFSGISPSWPGFFTITFCALTAGYSLADETWDNGGAPSTSWSTGANWADDIAPLLDTNVGVLTFTGSNGATPTITNNNISGLTTGNILFTNGTPPAVPAANSSGFTLGGNAITLGGDITTSSSGATGSGGIDITDTIALGLILDATRTITTTRTGGTGSNRLSHNLAISGQITESAGPWGLIKGGDANLALTNTGNSFTGDLTINGAGAVEATSLTPSGTASSIGSGTAINLVGGTLRFTGAVAPGADINRTINLTSTGTAGGILDNSGSAPITFNGTFTNAGAGAKAFQLIGNNTAANVFSSTLVNSSGGGVLSFTKSGTGAWALAGNNTFTGNVVIDNGTLRVSTINDSGSSNLGLGTLVQIGNSSRTGVLDYTGTGSTTTRQVKIGGFINTAGSGPATILASATSGTSTGLKFTATNFNAAETVTTTALTRILTLGGANTDSNEISGVIANGNSSVLTALTKSDAGLWILSGDNTYTGNTIINGGVLRAGHSNAFGATGTVTLNNTDTTLELANGITINRGLTISNAGDKRTIRLQDGATTGEYSGAITISEIGTGNFDISAAAGGTFTVSGVIGASAGAHISKAGAGTVVLSGDNSLFNKNVIINTGVLRAAHNNAFGSSGTVSLANTGTTLELADGITINRGLTVSDTGDKKTLKLLSGATAAEHSGAITNSETTAGNFDVSVGTSGTLTLSGKISTNTLTKTGVGTIVLSGTSDNNALLLNATGGEVRLGKDSSSSIHAVAGISGIADGATVTVTGSGGDQIFGGSGDSYGIQDIVAGGTLNLNGNSESVSYFSGAGGIVDGGIGTPTLTVGESNVSSSFGGVIQNSSGTLALTKMGSGTQTLTGANTYSGDTTITGGTLVINGSISTSTLTTVASGATLGGTGSAGKSVINGTLAVGNSAGKMDFTDTLGLNGTTIMEIDGTAGAGVIGGNDLVNLTGSGAAGVLTYGGAMTLDMGVIFAVGTYSWNLFDMASETEAFTTITLADQYSGSLVGSGGVWDLTSGDNTWKFIESTGVLGLTVIPEPNAAMLIGSLGMLTLLRRRRI